MKRPYSERPLPTVTDRERVSALRAICGKLGLNYDAACQVEVVGAIHKLQLANEALSFGLHNRPAHPYPPAADRGPRRAGWDA